VESQCAMRIKHASTSIVSRWSSFELTFIPISGEMTKGYRVVSPLMCTPNEAKSSRLKEGAVLLIE
jgi:hypothetical protein